LTHPVQYQVPLWRKLAARQDLATRCFYFSDQGASPKLDQGFGEVFEWDVPLLEGYPNEFISRSAIEGQNRFAITKPDRFFRSQQFNVVLLHGYNHRFARQTVRFRKRHGFKVVLHGEFSDLDRTRPAWKDWLREVYLRWFYWQVDHFCPIGSQAVRHLRRRGISDDRMTLVPYSVDDELLDQQFGTADREGCRRGLGIPEAQTVFLFSGKLLPRKQPLLLAEAALAAKHREFITLAFLGSGEEMEAVRQKLLPVFENRLIMPGFVNQSQLGRYFRAADVFVLPSQFDTWGLVVNEAMHFGLPCLVSDRVGCHPDLIVSGKTGFVFPYNQAQALRERMEWCLNHSGELKGMGQNAREHIQGFTSERAAQRLTQAILKTARPTACQQ
jgi:glycosyltransferase involved in cell wall biosynthesis